MEVLNCQRRPNLASSNNIIDPQEIFLVRTHTRNDICRDFRRRPPVNSDEVGEDGAVGDVVEHAANLPAVPVGAEGLAVQLSEQIPRAQLGCMEQII